jgi:hypothetical protein
MTWIGAAKEIFDSIGASCGVISLIMFLSSGRSRRPVIRLMAWGGAVGLAATAVLEWQYVDQPSARAMPIYQRLDADLTSRHCETHTIMTSQGAMTLEICLRDPGRPI